MCSLPILNPISICRSLPRGSIVETSVPLYAGSIAWSIIDMASHREFTDSATCDDAAAVGFDDRNFYHELAKHVADRLIPLKQALRDEACVALQLWLKKADRVRY